MDLSIVVPLYNEEQSVPPLCEAIGRAVEPLGYAFEVLLIDDGSTDATFDRALQVARRDGRFQVIKLSKNFGQTAALDAGFEHARGKIIVSMDGDLQNDPGDIGALMSKMQEGYDIVAGWRESRQDRWVTRKIPSRVANWLIRNLTGVPIRDNGCGLRAYRAEVIKKLPLYSEMHRLLPMIVALTGARIGEIPVRHYPRRHGSSKYGLTRIYKFLLDFTAIRIILSLFRMPLFGFGIFALPFLLLSVLAFLAGIVEVILEPDAPIVTYIGVSLLFGSLSVFLMMMGILCDLVYRTGSLKVEHLLNMEVVQGRKPAPEIQQGPY